MSQVDSKKKIIKLLLFYDYVHLGTTIIICNITEIFLLGVTVSQSITDTEELSNDSITSSFSSFLLWLEHNVTGSYKENTPFTSVLLQEHCK